jgi:hypothetical protein
MDGAEIVDYCMHEEPIEKDIGCSVYTSRRIFELNLRPTFSICLFPAGKAKARVGVGRVAGTFRFDAIIRGRRER